LQGKACPAKPTDAETDDDDVVSDEDEAADIDADIVQEQKAAEEAEKKMKGLKLALELGSLAFYMASTGFKGFDFAQHNCEWQCAR
jgi:hypothetical protein